MDETGLFRVYCSGGIRDAIPCRHCAFIYIVAVRICYK